MRLLLLALLAAVPASKGPPDLGTLTLDRTDPVIEATVAGMPARLAVVPVADIDLAPAFAARVPLDWQASGYQQVGRVRVPVREAAGEIGIAGTVQPHRMSTQDGPCCNGHDGAIGATELPWSIVRIGRGGRTPEQRWRMETDSHSGLNIPWKVGQQTIHILLAPDVPETTATASAAVLLARAYGGHLEDVARPAPIAFGVMRTVRDMRFDRAVPLLPFRLDRIAVRVADFAGDTKLLETMKAEAPAGDGGEDAITVRHRPVPPQFRWPAITVGRDWLDRCPVISIYRDAGTIGLVCDPA